MLAEYGLIPDIFEPAAYSSPEVCDLRLSRLKEVLLNQGLVRNFREGEWQAYVTKHTERWDKRAKELVRKLTDQNRLVGSTAILPDSPTNEVEWCREALASHSADPFTGIITTARNSTNFANESAVSSIERLDTAVWWQSNNESVHLARRTKDYLKHLSLILRHANFLMFVDPHLDPRRDAYSEFIRLLLAAKRSRGCAPKIQIHRVCYVGRGPGRSLLNQREWREAFERLQRPLENAGLSADVFIWDEFHDRYFVSNLVGILVPNGFDVSGNLNERTIWARISRSDRERVQREFDHPNNAFRELHGKFTVGKLGG
jgi:hypothetical protein